MSERNWRNVSGLPGRSPSGCGGWTWMKALESTEADWAKIQSTWCGGIVRCDTTAETCEAPAVQRGSELEEGKYPQGHALIDIGKAHLFAPIEGEQ